MARVLHATNELITTKTERSPTSLLSVPIFLVRMCSFSLRLWCDYIVFGLFFYLLFHKPLPIRFYIITRSFDAKAIFYEPMHQSQSCPANFCVLSNLRNLCLCGVNWIFRWNAAQFYSWYFHCSSICELCKFSHSVGGGFYGIFISVVLQPNRKFCEWTWKMFAERSGNGTQSIK